MPFPLIFVQRDVCKHIDGCFKNIEFVARSVPMETVIGIATRDVILEIRNGRSASFLCMARRSILVQTKKHGVMMFGFFV